MNRTKILMISCCMALCLSACGMQSSEDAGLHIEQIPADESSQAGDVSEITSDTSGDTDSKDVIAAEKDSSDSEGGAAATDAISQEQALEAIKNYCFINNPDLEGMVGSDEYTINWDVTTNEAGEIVVLFRSYTAAEIRYYINPASGETYVTERVPGIIDEEQRTDESFNVKDYMG